MSVGLRFRVGRKVGRTIYRDDVLIGMMDRPGDAAMVVAALNGPGAEIQRLHLEARTDVVALQHDIYVAEQERDAARFALHREQETHSETVRLWNAQEAAIVEQIASYIEGRFDARFVSKFLASALVDIRAGKWKGTTP